MQLNNDLLIIRKLQLSGKILCFGNVELNAIKKESPNIFSTGFQSPVFIRS